MNKQAEQLTQAQEEFDEAFGEGITIDEAIETLPKPPPTFGIIPKTKYQDSIKLGIEALKVLKHGRLIGAHHDPHLLPGERRE